MRWNDSTKFRGVIITGDHIFRSIKFLEWRPTVAEVKEELRKIKTGGLTFIRNERNFSSLPYKAFDHKIETV